MKCRLCYSLKLHVNRLQLLGYILHADALHKVVHKVIHLTVTIKLPCSMLL